jgi:hypothetical protein
MLKKKKYNEGGEKIKFLIKKVINGYVKSVERKGNGFGMKAKSQLTTENQLLLTYWFCFRIGRYMFEERAQSFVTQPVTNRPPLKLLDNLFIICNFT